MSSPVSPSEGSRFAMEEQACYFLGILTMPIAGFHDEESLRKFFADFLAGLRMEDQVRDSLALDYSFFSGADALRQWIADHSKRVLEEIEHGAGKQSQFSGGAAAVSGDSSGENDAAVVRNDDG